MNEVFLNRMKCLLGSDYEAYLETLDQPCFQGLRVNTSKLSLEEFKELSICTLTPSAICPQSFQIKSDRKGLGNHPAHLGGLFYMQEPSAASAVEILDVKENDWVLDLCAAPGGKSTQIAAKLNHTGFLLSNEIEKKRAMILLSNMERLGFSECMITNANPSDLCEQVQGCFDKVLVDAPCSGEGMFKKQSKAMEDWSIEHVSACSTRQLLILESAYQTIKQEGVLVYSTCTYAMEENEEVIYSFLQKHPDMELVDPQVSFGRIGYPYKDLDFTKLRRILPMDQGEGHFIAKMKKHGESIPTKLKEVKNTPLPAYVQSFLMEQIQKIPSYHIQIKDKIYLKNTPFIQIDKIPILRQGTLLGELTKNRLEPHPHFYTSSLYEADFRNRYEMSEEECKLYIRGNLLAVKGYKGYVVLCWHLHPIGFGKGDGTVIKNKYPKGLRVKGN